MRRIRTFVMVAAMSLGAVVALAAPGGGSGAGSGQGSAGASKGPPPAAFDACAKLKEGDACSFQGMGGKERTGTCVMPKKKELAGKGLLCRAKRGGDGRGAGTGGGGGSGGGAGSGSAAKAPPPAKPGAGSGSGKK